MSYLIAKMHFSPITINELFLTIANLIESTMISIRSMLCFYNDINLLEKASQK